MYMQNVLITYLSTEPLFCSSIPVYITLLLNSVLTSSKEQMHISGINIRVFTKVEI